MAIDNLEEVLRKGDFSLANVVRMTIYTTDVDALISADIPVALRLEEAKCRSAQTLLGVRIW